VFSKFKRTPVRQRIDLASVRDTLLYIESDLNEMPELHRLASAVRDCLAEIDRMELVGNQFEAPQITNGRFLATRL
jgi:hypothetical protein